MNRILLVNDHDEVTDRTAAMLEAMGWEVYVAHTEQYVFESIVACRPTLLISDVEMDAGVGFESIATARRLFQDLFIIAVTRGAHRDIWPRVASVCGANRYLVGPVSAPQLADVIGLAVDDGLIDSAPERRRRH